MRTLLLTFAATLLCAGAYAADPELYCADLTYDGFTTRSYTFATRGDRTLVLEIDLPERGDASGPRPFVVYVPGGSWRTCGIGAFRRQSAYLASQGIAGVRIVYSLVGDGADFSAGLEELQAARDLVAARAGELGLDTLRFGYVAASAGTPLAADEALSQAGCRFFVGYNGIYDLTRRIDGSRFPEEGTPYLAPFSDGELRDFSPVNRIGAARRRAVPRPGRPHDLVEAVAAVLRCGSCGGRTCRDRSLRRRPPRLLQLREVRLPRGGHPQDGGVHLLRVGRVDGASPAGVWLKGLADSVSPFRRPYGKVTRPASAPFSSLHGGG